MDSDNSSGQATSTIWQLRSSGQAPKVSLDSLAIDQISSVQRQAEIDRIVDGGPDEVFSDYHMRTNAEMLEIYKLLSRDIDPDRQTEVEWKERAAQAQRGKFTDSRSKVA